MGKVSAGRKGANQSQVKGETSNGIPSAPGVDSYLDLGRSVPANALAAINPGSEAGVLPGALQRYFLHRRRYPGDPRKGVNWEAFTLRLVSQPGGKTVPSQSNLVRAFVL